MKFKWPIIALVGGIIAIVVLKKKSMNPGPELWISNLLSLADECAFMNADFNIDMNKDDWWGWD